MLGMTERQQSLGEEIANSASHGVALLAAICAVPFLIASTSRLNVFGMVGTIVFAATLVLLYLTSTLYHALPVGRAKRIFLKLDFASIYLFIAGSYTPFALGALGVSAWGKTLFSLIWLLAAIGVTLKAFNRLTHPWLSTGLYLGMGWLVLIAAVPLVERVPMPVVLLLLAGGIAYTIGVVFFVLDARIRYSHAVWHAFVATGSGCHFFAVLGYVA